MPEPRVLRHSQRKAPAAPSGGEHAIDEPQVLVVCDQRMVELTERSNPEGAAGAWMPTAHDAGVTHVEQLAHADFGPRPRVRKQMRSCCYTIGLER